jgi:succinyl-CoA synthetase alpha subunit
MPPTPFSKPPTPASRSWSCVTEGIPVLDMMKVKADAEPGAIARCRLIGPNCPGIITPATRAREAKIGIMPGYIHKRPASAAWGSSHAPAR